MSSNKKSSVHESKSGLTMKDLAAIAGVSTITVSRALRQSPLVNEETRENIQKIAEQQGYRLNISARNLRLRRSYSIAVVVEMAPAKERPMSDPYPLELLGGITQELTSAGYSAVLTSKQLIHTAPVQAADGLILLGQGPNGEAARDLQSTNLPLIVWGAPRLDATYIVVGSDNQRGGYSVAERFLSLGRSKLLFVGDINHAEVKERHAGFIKALGNAGASVEILCPRAFTFEAGFESLSHHLDQQHTAFDGVFAASDLLAMGAIRALTEKNISIPNEVSVIGYDDTPGAASFIPTLTSVHQYLTDGGILLAKKMLALIDGEKVTSEMLPTKLVVRQT